MNYVLVFLGSIVEILIIYNFWTQLLVSRYSKKKTALIYFLVEGVVVINATCLFQNIGLKGIISQVISVTLLGVLFKDKWIKKITIHVIYVTLVFVADILSMFIAKYVFHHDLVNILDGSVASYLWTITSQLFIFIFTIIGLMVLKKEKLSSDSRVIQLGFLHIATQLVVVFLIISSILDKSFTNSKLFLFLMFAVIFSFGIGSLVMYSVKEMVKPAAEADFMKIENEMKNKHFCELQEQYESVRRLRHDFNNHLKLIGALQNIEEVRTYVQELQEIVSSIERLNFCNHAYLDSLLAVKYREALDKKIKINISACDCKNIENKYVDVCIVIANLLDNAIEAAEKTENPYIELIMRIKAERLIIVLKNSTKLVADDFQTTKRNKAEHGIGLKSIQKIAKKYDGDAVFRYTENEFVSIVNLMC